MAGRVAAVAAALAAAWPSLLAAAPASPPQLPASRACGDNEADRGCAGARRGLRGWWAQVHDELFYPPPTSMLELSQNISDYYYAVGHPSAITEELRAHRVAGAGLYHIFHLPGGPSTLQLPSAGSRRTAFSPLAQLRAGAVLGDYPAYHARPDYTNPLGDSARALEQAMVGEVTPGLFGDILKEITLIGADGVATRSWENRNASNAAVEHLQEQFLKFGLSSCLEKSPHEGGEVVNVVAMIPGTSLVRDALLMVAHYDSRPFQGPAPGAEDNGSGMTAMLINAKLAAAHGVKPVKDIIFAAVGAEEVGILGSRHLVPELQRGIPGFRQQLTNGPPQKFGECQSAASSFLQRAVKRVGYNSAIVFDEVGWASPKRQARTVNFETHDTAKTSAIMQHLAHANVDYNGAELSIEHSSNPCGSDHMPFLNNGEAAVLLINSDDSDYPCYHMSCDTFEKVDLDYGVRVAKLALSGMLRFASVDATTMVA